MYNVAATGFADFGIATQFVSQPYDTWQTAYDVAEGFREEHHKKKYTSSVEVRPSEEKEGWWEGTFWIADKRAELPEQVAKKEAEEAEWRALQVEAEQERTRRRRLIIGLSAGGAVVLTVAVVGIVVGVRRARRNR